MSTRDLGDRAVGAAVHHDRLGPGARRDADHLAVVRVDQPVVDGELGGDPDPVAAHLDGGAVGVAVVHEDVGVGLVRGRRRRAG